MLLAGIVGCASLAPRKIYVLDNANDAAVEAFTAHAAPVLRLERVLVPDYLDTTDILTRSGGHELQSSRTGQWGERLSLGITHALRADLAVRLPTQIVAGTQPTDKGVHEILVSVDTFNVWADGHCILTANWSLLERDRRNAELTEHGTFTTPAASGGTPSDATVVAGMADAVSQLADGIASTVKRL
jgi:uncharacterized lipoprotein YmbA